MRIGPTRKLLLAEMSLLDSLGLELEPHVVSPTMAVLVVEFLLLAALVSRIVAMYLAGQFQDFALATTVSVVFSGASMEEIDRENMATFHILSSTVGHVLLVPQLYMLVVVSREEVTLVLQLVLVLLLVVLTAVTQGVHAALKTGDACEDKHLCLHQTWGWFLFLNILLFVTIIGVRLLFHIRLKSWLLGFRMVGPILEFLVSRKCRDYQALCLLLSLSAATLSGMVSNAERLSTSSLSVGAVVTDLVSCLLTLAALMVLVGLYLLTHCTYAHSKVVTHHHLGRVLHLLGENHREVLRGDLAISRDKYCPYTRYGTVYILLFLGKPWLSTPTLRAVLSL